MKQTIRKCLECRVESEQLDTTWDKLRWWLFNKFHRDILDLSQDKYTQGFSDGYQKGIEHAKEREREYMNELLKEIETLRIEKGIGRFALKPEHIVTIDKNKVLVGGVEMNDSQKAQLHMEAGMIEQTLVWSVMQETLKSQAEQVMFEKSKDFEDMRTGKAMLYNLDVQKKIVELFKRLKPTPKQIEKQTITKS